MATNQAKKTGARSGGSSRRKTSAPKSSTGTGRGGKTRKSAAAANYQARMVWGGILLMLSVFSALCWFHTDGLFIRALETLERGLAGWGWWSVPLCLFAASCQLFFARGRPVRLRVFCALLIPALLGASAHTLTGSMEFVLMQDGIRRLWELGGAEYTGGVIGGVTAIGLSRVFSRAGAFLTLLVLAVLILMALTRTTPEMVGEWFGRRREAHEERSLQRAAQREAEEAEGIPHGPLAFLNQLIHPYDEALEEPEEEDYYQEPQPIVERPRRKKRIKDYDLEVDGPITPREPKVEPVVEEEYDPQLLEDETRQTVPARLGQRRGGTLEEGRIKT
jgi:S-DNA-T family DNA segregation ATPase FtsK/SpoIIIE